MEALGGLALIVFKIYRAQELSLPLEKFSHAAAPGLHGGGLVSDD